MQLHPVRRVATLALALLLAMLAAAAPPAGKVSRIGILGQAASDPAEARVWQSFRLALRERLRSSTWRNIVPGHVLALRDVPPGSRT